MRLSLLLSLLLLPSAVLFADVDLTAQLSRPIHEQHGGNCSVVAALDLMEAACFRATGKHFQLSEAFYTSCRMVDKLDREHNILWEPPAEGFLTQADGGNSEDTLHQVLERKDVCTSDGEERPEAFYAFLAQRARKAHQDLKDEKDDKANAGLAIGGSAGVLAAGVAWYGLNRLMRRNNSTKACGLWFSRLSRVGQATAVAAAGYFGARYGKEKALDEPDDDSKARKRFQDDILKRMREHFKDVNTHPELEKCLNAMVVPHAQEDATHAQMKALLDKGIPFICGGNYDDNNRISPYDDANKQDAHVAIVVGYRADAAAPGGVRYLVRNAWGKKADHWEMPATGCPSLVTLLNQSEKAHGRGLRPLKQEE